MPVENKNGPLYEKHLLLLAKCLFYFQTVSVEEPLPALRKSDDSLQNVLRRQISVNSSTTDSNKWPVRGPRLLVEFTDMKCRLVESGEDEGKAERRDTDVKEYIF